MSQTILCLATRYSQAPTAAHTFLTPGPPREFRSIVLYRNAAATLSRRGKEYGGSP